MAIVEKLNKVLMISDEKVEEYLKMGYDLVDENGKIIQASTAITLEGLKRENEELKASNKKLDAKVKKLETENRKLKAEKE